MTGRFFDDFILEEKSLFKLLPAYEDHVNRQKSKIDEIYKTMENAKGIHVYGKGRSGSSAVSLALRLKHFGYNVSFIGDVVKEQIKTGDMVILFSGSGETSDIVDIAKKSKTEKINAKVVAITSYEDSTLGKSADIVFILPGGMEKRKGWEYLGAQLTRNEGQLYGGGEFEVLSYLFQENLVNAIGKRKNIPLGEVAKQHERDEIQQATT